MTNIHPKSMSNKQLGKDVAQLLRFVACSDEARNLLAEVQTRLQHSEIDAIHPSGRGIITLVKFVMPQDTGPDQVTPVVQDVLGKHLGERLALHLGNTPEQNMFQAITTRLRGLMEDVCTYRLGGRIDLEWLLPPGGVEQLVIQHLEDFSDWRVMFFGMNQRGPYAAVMITPSDVYPFSVRIKASQAIDSTLFPFWNHDEVYREIKVDQEGDKAYLTMWVYSLAQEIRYVHERNNGGPAK